MYKIINGIAGLKFDDFFVRRSQPYQLRKNEFKIDTHMKFKSSTWTNSFYVRAVKLWNALPENVCSISSLQSFKTKLNNMDLNSLVELLNP